MAIFVSAYGAEAGNLAVRTVATRGLYIGGGIAPKNITLLEQSGVPAGLHGQGADDRDAADGADQDHPCAAGPVPVSASGERTPHQYEGIALR
jgi:hypothetical protein